MRNLHGRPESTVARVSVTPISGNQRTFHLQTFGCSMGCVAAPLHTMRTIVQTLGGAEKWQGAAVLFSTTDVIASASQ